MADPLSFSFFLALVFVLLCQTVVPVRADDIVIPCRNSTIATRVSIRIASSWNASSGIWNRSVAITMTETFRNSTVVSGPVSGADRFVLSTASLTPVTIPQISIMVNSCNQPQMDVIVETITVTTDPFNATAGVGPNVTDNSDGLLQLQLNVSVSRSQLNSLQISINSQRPLQRMVNAVDGSSYRTANINVSVSAVDSTFGDGGGSNGVSSTSTCLNSSSSALRSGLATLAIVWSVVPPSSSSVSTSAAPWWYLPPDVRNGSTAIVVPIGLVLQNTSVVMCRAGTTVLVNSNDGTWNSSGLPGAIDVVSASGNSTIPTLLQLAVSITNATIATQSISGQFDADCAANPAVTVRWFHQLVSSTVTITASKLSAAYAPRISCGTSTSAFFSGVLGLATFANNSATTSVWWSTATKIRLAQVTLAATGRTRDATLRRLGCAMMPVRSLGNDVSWSNVSCSGAFGISAGRQLSQTRVAVASSTFVVADYAIGIHRGWSWDSSLRGASDSTLTVVSTSITVQYTDLVQGGASVAACVAPLPTRVQDGFVLYAEGASVRMTATNRNDVVLWRNVSVAFRCTQVSVNTTWISLCFNASSLPTLTAGFAIPADATSDCALSFSDSQYLSLPPSFRFNQTDAWLVVNRPSSNRTASTSNSSSTSSSSVVPITVQNALFRLGAASGYTAVLLVDAQSGAPLTNASVVVFIYRSLLFDAWGTSVFDARLQALDGLNAWLFGGSLLNRIMGCSRSTSLYNCTSYSNGNTTGVQVAVATTTTSTSSSLVPPVADKSLCYVPVGWTETISSSASASPSLSEMTRSASSQSLGTRSPSLSASPTRTGPSWSVAQSSSVTDSFSDDGFSPTRTFSGKDSETRSRSLSKTWSEFPVVSLVVVSPDYADARVLLYQPVQVKIVVVGSSFNQRLALCADIPFEFAPMANINTTWANATIPTFSGLGMYANVTNQTSGTPLSPAAIALGLFVASNASLRYTSAIAGVVELPPSVEVYRQLVDADVTLFFRIPKQYSKCFARGDVTFHFAIPFRRLQPAVLTLGSVDESIQSVLLAATVALVAAPFAAADVTRMTQPSQVLMCQIPAVPLPRTYSVVSWSFVQDGTWQSYYMGALVIVAAWWVGMFVLHMWAAMLYGCFSGTTIIKGSIAINFPSLWVFPVLALVQPAAMLSTTLIYVRPTTDAEWFGIGGAAAVVVVVLSVTAWLQGRVNGHLLSMTVAEKPEGNGWWASHGGTVWRSHPDHEVWGTHLRYQAWFDDYRSPWHRLGVPMELVVSAALGALAGIPLGERQCTYLLYASGAVFCARFLLMVALRPFRSIIMNVIVGIVAAIQTAVCAALLALDWIPVEETDKRDSALDTASWLTRIGIYAVILEAFVAFVIRLHRSFAPDAADGKLEVVPLNSKRASQPVNMDFMFQEASSEAHTERLMGLIDKVTDDVDRNSAMYDPALRSALVAAHMELLLPGCEASAIQHLWTVVQALDAHAVELGDPSSFTASMNELHEVLQSHENLNRKAEGRALDFSEVDGADGLEMSPVRHDKDLDASQGLQLRRASSGQQRSFRLRVMHAESPEHRQFFLDSILGTSPQHDNVASLL